MIDIGANLSNPVFEPDRAAVIERAKLAGVEAIIVTGTDLPSSVRAVQLSQENPGFLYATAGLHPHDADSFDDQTLAGLERLLQRDEVVAIGETGLDFNRNYSSRDNQLAAFEAQLSLTRHSDKPLFLHERDANDDFAAVIRNLKPASTNAVVHCFTGDLAALKCYLDLGLFIGITGWICDQKRGALLRDIIRYAPLDRLMIETDAPYLNPLPKREKQRLTKRNRNEPWTLSYTATALAIAVNQDVETLLDLTTQTTNQFFQLSASDKRPPNATRQ